MDDTVVVWTQVYQSEKTLCRAIESVLSQTYGDFIYYVLDNGSGDHCGEIIAEYASRDKRVVPLKREKNYIMAGVDYIPQICERHKNQYLCWLDSDDAYDTSFLDKTLRFMRKNDLDIAACGTTELDLESGTLLREKRADTDLVIEGRDFADKFIKYRTFTNEMWGKIFPCKLISRELMDCYPGWHGDSMVIMNMLYHSDRFGVLAECLHRNYRHANSDSNDFLNDKGRKSSVIGGALGLAVGTVTAMEYWHEMYKLYLKKYGELSRENEEYLYAIHMGYIEHFLPMIYHSDFSGREKLSLLMNIFRSPTTQALIKGTFSSRFHNLSHLEAFLQETSAEILRCDPHGENGEMAHQIIALMR